MESPLSGRRLVLVTHPCAAAMPISRRSSGAAKSVVMPSASASGIGSAQDQAFVDT